LAGCFAIVAVWERSATDIGGNSSVFVRMSIFCGSAGLNDSVFQSFVGDHG
jgi:hypothetical protein